MIMAIEEEEIKSRKKEQKKEKQNNTRETNRVGRIYGLGKIVPKQIC